MSDKLCGICFSNYSNLPQHLRFLHKVINPQEYELLVKFGNARYNGPLNCSLCDKSKLVRLDKHLFETHDIKAYEEREPLMKDAKRNEIIKQLAILRSSQPQIPMVSNLGIASVPSADTFLEPKPLDKDQPPDEDHFSMELEKSELQMNWTQLRTSTPNDEPGTHCNPSEHLELDDSSVPCGQTFVESLLPTSSSAKPMGSATSRENSAGGSAYSKKLDEISARLEKLEQSLIISQTQQKTPKKARTKHPTFGSAQKGELVDKTRDPSLMYEVVLNDFEKFRVGARTARKDLDNAHQSRSHAKRFCLYMLGNMPSSAGQQDLKFLNQIDKLRLFPRYLAKKGYAPTTVKNMLGNVILFLKHIESSFGKYSKLTQTELSKIFYEIKRLQADVMKKVTVHRQKVLRKKTDNELHAAVETKFLTVAQERVPKLLEDLDQDQNFLHSHNKLMGYILGYLAILTGHRSIVFTNMTKDNVISADSWKNNTRFRILVDDHKTVRSFGQAAIFLSKEEYGWLDQLINISCCDQSSSCKFVFHTITGNQMFKPVTFLQEAWIDAGLKGTVNFTQIRSSVSTQANRCLSVEERQRVAKAMCHDPNTAERFYVSLPDKNSGYSVRKLRMKALKMSAQHSRNDDSSDDEEEVPQEDCESNTTDETSATEDENESQLADDDMASSLSLSDEDEQMATNGETSPESFHLGLSNSDSELESESSKAKRKLDFPHRSGSKLHDQDSFGARVHGSLQVPAVSSVQNICKATFDPPVHHIPEETPNPLGPSSPAQGGAEEIFSQEIIYDTVPDPGMA